MADLTTINSNIVNKVSGFQFGGVFKALGWLLLALIVIGGCGYAAYVYYEKKKYNKKTTDFESINGTWTPSFRDSAKTVKLGRGGFQILYLKKLKTWRLAYGGRVGVNTYYFFIGKDGYPYNGILAADIHYINEHGGLIPVVTTNPTMRAQYTALEKQIEALHADKKGIWEKYGNWILSMTFVVIIGIFTWLIYREIGGFLGSGSTLAQQMTALAEQMNKLAVNLNNAQGGSGLTPAG